MSAWALTSQNISRSSVSNLVPGTSSLLHSYSTFIVSHRSYPCFLQKSCQKALCFQAGDEWPLYNNIHATESTGTMWSPSLCPLSSENDLFHDAGVWRTTDGTPAN